MQFVLPDGYNLNVEEVGSGFPLIVLHGGPGLDHTMFRPYLDALGDEYRLLYVDERGQGRSQRVDPATLSTPTSRPRSTHSARMARRSRAPGRPRRPSRPTRSSKSSCATSCRSTSTASRRPVTSRTVSALPRCSATSRTWATALSTTA